ncbi:MAG: hypothetical protein V4665_02385, partial [Patescibacteria group bacterium]
MKKKPTRMKAAWVTAAVIVLLNSSWAVAQKTDIKTSPLWNHFLNVSGICRCSGSEAEAAKMIFMIAWEKSFPVKVDSFYNVLVYVPASIGYEDRPPISLQSHIDMVCQAKDGRNAGLIPK